ncbi:DUF2971 domain-containing protein [Clostridium lundense]|uniref:DUF2971 domain-containing protein n=1 Tax=Clostridium lundense TaxID=319475 RepID=UPI0004830119|nr:DUF2971 domain-containing protein [Clostridium lundense]
MEFIALDSQYVLSELPLFRNNTLPDKLYHYTSIYALKNILETNSLWVTNSKFLNDSTEIKYGYNLICKIAEELKKEKKLSDDFYMLIIDNLNYLIDSKLNGIYVFSLAKEKDSLLLWSNYSNFEGYNLGINVKDFLQQVEKYGEISGAKKSFNVSMDTEIYMRTVTLKEDLIQTDKYFNDKNEFFMSYNEVIYDKEKQIEYIKYILTNVNTYYMKHYDEKYLKKLQRFTGSLLMELYNVLLFFKEPAFKQEEEYRIIFIKNNSSKEFKNHRILNGSFIPYIELRFKESNFPLDSLSIGPRNNSDIALIGLKSFLHKNNFNINKINLYNSKIPLRY